LLVRGEQIGRLKSHLGNWAKEEEELAEMKAAEAIEVPVADAMELPTLAENEPMKTSGDNHEEIMIDEEMTKDEETDE
jgi:hypothetical protein